MTHFVRHNKQRISNDELDKCAKDQNVSIGRGDFVIIRTGQMERCLAEKDWGGYAGGDAPGVKFENCYWCQEKEIAAICTDTWGVEVRPNETKEANQPWHWVVIPAMGLCMGEIFYLKELADDCGRSLSLIYHHINQVREAFKAAYAGQRPQPRSKACHPSAPGIGTKSGPIANRVRLSCPHQPASRGSGSPRRPCRSWTKHPATHPGPPLRYL